MKNNADCYLKLRLYHQLNKSPTQNGKPLKHLCSLRQAKESATSVPLYVKTFQIYIDVRSLLNLSYFHNKIPSSRIL